MKPAFLEALTIGSSLRRHSCEGSLKDIYLNWTHLTPDMCSTTQTPEPTTELDWIRSYWENGNGNPQYPGRFGLRALENDHSVPSDSETDWWISLEIHSLWSSPSCSWLFPVCSKSCFLSVTLTLLRVWLDSNERSRRKHRNRSGCPLSIKHV